MKGSSPLAHLAALYDEVDALFAGWSCPRSTECCRFGVTGREPYVTSVEREALLAALAGRPPSPARLALPLADDAAAERICPLLQSDGGCAAYAARPLGCRTYFCARADAPGKAPRAALADIVRRLRDLAAQHEPGGELGRPLSRVLPETRRPRAP